DLDERPRRRRKRSDDDESRARHALAGPKPRRVTWRVLLFFVLLLALAGGVVATIQWYGQSAYFVGFDGDQVAIFQGRPGGVLWIDPELVETTELERERVPEDRVEELEAGVEQSTRADAEAYVARVTERAEELSPTTTESTTTTRPTTTTTAAPPNP
ncbi:MAG TPA: hypothetical protein VKA42_02205, partial [Acidimicrobiales bacterium]|nr:hypothetical protein [Acidimicrobiales bacterium]